MKKLLNACAAVALGVAAWGEARAQLFNASPLALQAAGAQQQQAGRAVGEVSSIDAAAKQFTVKTESGELVKVQVGEQASVVRVPPGATSSANAAKISLADISIGDRVFVRGDAAGAGTLAARQVVVTKAEAAGRERGRQGRGLVGRVSALNPQTKEITVQARGREGAEQVTIVANAPGVRFLRFAPDSTQTKDAVPGAFADIRVGDQIRAAGERSDDGSRLTAEEVVSGSFARIGGTVTDVNASAKELTIKESQTGQSVVVRVGARSTLRHITSEQIAAFNQEREQRRGQRRERRERDDAQGGGRERPADRDGAREGRQGGEWGGNRRPGGGGGRGLQQLLENLPALALADLKKGDTVVVTGSTSGADASRMTAVTLLTGDKDFLTRMLTQGRGRDGREMSTGLPGDVIGGGSPTDRSQPGDRPRP